MNRQPPYSYFVLVEMGSGTISDNLIADEGDVGAYCVRPWVMQIFLCFPWAYARSVSKFSTYLNKSECVPVLANSIILDLSF